MIYTIYPCPVSFCPLDLFCPHIILPPGNRLMIYTIYPCPVSFCPLDSFCPISFCPLSFCPPPWKSFNVHYFPMSRIISPPPPYHFAPWKLFHDLHYLPMSSIILPPGFILPPYHFAPHFAPWKWFNDLHYLPISRIILPPALDFVSILIKSHL